jgi:hypothetical protein
VSSPARALRRAALGALAGLLLGGAPSRAEEPDVMPPGAMQEDVFYLCTACHSSHLVTRQAMSRERWDDTLTWMTERHGMGELEGDYREAVLDYLAEHFGPDAQAAGSAAPFLRQPQRRNPFLAN